MDSAHTKDRQAGADVGITSEMVEAGASAIREELGPENVHWHEAREAAPAVFKAMLGQLQYRQ